MILTIGDLEALRIGLRSPIVIGEVPFAVQQVLQLRVPNVYLSPESLSHIKVRHPDVGDFDLLLLPMAISRGLLVREIAKPNVIQACYQDPESYKRFVAVMKITNRDSEIWLQSFHRLKKRQTAQILKRSTILKKHD